MNYFDHDEGTKGKFVIGFTGTREGMSNTQLVELTEFLEKYKTWYDVEFRHGDCIGADEQAHLIASAFGFRIVVHPPNDTMLRAYCAFAEEIRSPKAFLTRNHDIVDASDIVIAAPRTSVEELRSGTWATIRYARKTGKRVEIILP